MTTPRPATQYTGGGTSGTGGGGGAGSDSSSGSDSGGGGGGAILTIFIVAALIAGLAFVLKDEDRRSWLMSMVPSMPSRPAYNYKTVNKGYESELSNGLLYDSDGDDDDEEDEEELPLGGSGGGMDSMGMAIQTSDIDLAGDTSQATANDDDEEMLPL